MTASRDERRSFLKLLTAGVATGTFAANKAVLATENRLTFFVAGARFHVAPAGLKIGTPVTFEFAQYCGAPSCRVVTLDGHMIGFVPRYLVTGLQKMGGPAGHLSTVDYAGLPWKRFGVTAWAGSAAAT